MDTVIVGKFGQWQQASPVVLRVFDEDPQIGFERLILMLGLPIRLQVEGGAQASLELNSRAYLSPHPANKQ